MTIIYTKILSNRLNFFLSCLTAVISPIGNIMSDPIRSDMDALPNLKLLIAFLQKWILTRSCPGSTHWTSKKTTQWKEAIYYSWHKRRSTEYLPVEVVARKWNIKRDKLREAYNEILEITINDFQVRKIKRNKKRNFRSPLWETFLSDKVEVGMFTKLSTWWYPNIFGKTLLK